MGLTWAAGWALAGILIGVSSILLPFLPWDAFFKVFDAPLPALAIPGFVGGAIFSIVLGTAGRRRRFDELSLPAFTAWGAVGGLFLSLVPAAMVAVGLASLANPDDNLWQITAVIGGPLVVLSAASAAGSLIIARRAQSRGSVDTSADFAETASGDAETPGQLRGGDGFLDAQPGARHGERAPDPIASSPPRDSRPPRP
jgi:hypothetical protein